MATGETYACSPWSRGVADGVIHPPHFSLNMLPSSMLVVVGFLLLLRMALLLILLLVLLLLLPPLLLLILIIHVIFLDCFSSSDHGLFTQKTSATKHSLNNNSATSDRWGGGCIFPRIDTLPQ